MLKKFWMGIVTILCAIAITITINYAWFVSGYDVDPLATGSSVDAYYLKGSGTELDPYIITTPRHLYNLAWLQYLGTYNKPTTNGGTTYESTYFKLGTTANGTLDMTGWPLPPIGTAKYPFIGNFNGNGWTISNLTTTNNFTEFGDKHPSGITANGANGTDAFEQANCGTIGFFGAIGAYNNSVISDTVTTSTEGVSYPTTTNTATNFYLNNTNVHTKTQSTIIGAVAGYVNATLSQIGVIQPHLNIATTSESAKLGSNFSDFAVVGYAESQYTTQKTKSSTIIYNPTYEYSHFNFKGMGSQADWGGSMNMTDLYNRLVSINNVSPTSMTSGSAYTGYELRYNNINKNKINANTTYTRTSQEDSNSVVPIYYLDAGGSNGTYLKTQTSSSWSVAYQGLTALYKDVVIVTKTSTVLDGFTISNNNQNSRYLNISSTRITNTIDFNVVINHESDTARTWVIDNNKIYTYNEDDGYAYYLVGNSDLSLSVTNDDSLASTWTWDSTTYRTTIGSTNYYLKYFNGEWTLKNTYAISDGNNHYIKYDTTQSNNIGTATSLADATPFMFTNEGTYPSGKIYTNNKVYLRNNNTTLQLNTTDSNNEWNNNGNQLFRSISNALYYIQYNSGWVLTTPTQYYIQYNGNYLYLNNSGQIQTAGTTNINTATAFTIPNSLLTGTISNPSTGKISATIGNNTYYLRYNNNALTTTSGQNDSGTTWSYDGHGFYQTNTNKYYIQRRNNIWQMSSTVAQITLDYCYISYNNYYLNATTNGVSGSTTAITKWYIDGDNYIYTIIDGTNYYLGAASGDIANVFTSPTDARYPVKGAVNDYIYETGYTNYRLNYTNNTWRFSTGINTYPSWKNTIDDYDNTPLGYATAQGINALNLSNMSSSQSINKTVGTAENPITINEYTREDDIQEPSLFNYIPLNALSSSPYTVDNNNTGYIMSGGYHPESHFDIRVSRYGLSYISSSYGNGAWKNNAILTVGANGYGTAKYIGSSTYPESMFSKYTASKEQLLSTLQSNSSYVFGLHFMNAAINKNRLVTAPSVKINGETYTNYKMPENSIDFQLASKGYINFFAGSYFTNNDSFFSLHQIIRNSSNEITDVKHISKIYAANSSYGDGWKSVDFIYQYVGGTWSGTDVSSNSKYSLAFDKDWIENPESLGNDLYNNFRNYLWYFEIPVNKGEYALGSVDGGIGAYLIYLDIGANAAPVDRTRILQETSTTKEGLKYVNGIQILASGAYTSDADSAVAKVSTSINGDVDISRSTNTITFTASSSLPSTYKGEGITLSGATWSPTSSNTTVSKVLRYVDYNRSTDKLYYTTIYNNGTTNTGYDCYRIDNITTGAKTQITDTSVNAEWGILVINSGSGTPTSLNSFDNIATTQGYTFGTTKILDYYSYINTTNLASLTETIEMSVAADTTVVPQADGEYRYEHSYHLAGDAITMAPNDLLVYIGPDLKNSVTITYANNVATVTDSVSNVSYTFTFNASAVDNTNKTITIFVSSS